MRFFLETFSARPAMAVVGFCLLASSVVAGAASAQSVDPQAWVQSDLLELIEGTYTYDHRMECSIRDKQAQPSERTLARIRATAPEGAISRDQLVALIQRMETVFLLSIGQSFRETASAMAIVSMLDCRPRPESKESATRELILDVSESGFISEFVDHATGARSKHAETWPEAFRP